MTQSALIKMLKQTDIGSLPLQNPKALTMMVIKCEDVQINGQIKKALLYVFVFVRFLHKGKKNVNKDKFNFVSTNLAGRVTLRPGKKFISL